MLTFAIIGPDSSGLYSIVYSTPGNLQKTLHTGGLATDAAVRECARLNEEQVAGKRQAIVDKANRIVKDL